MNQNLYESVYFTWFIYLYDRPQTMNKLSSGVKMEIQDCNYDLLENVLITSSGVGFKDAEVAILLG